MARFATGRMSRIESIADTDAPTTTTCLSLKSSRDLNCFEWITRVSSSSENCCNPEFPEQMEHRNDH